MLGRPEFYVNRGTLSLSATDLRHVGIGELLARLERLKQVLAAEGLFAADRKRPLPFLPAGVGLVCGRGSAAEQDVLENAARRWPAVSFAVKNVPVQGPYAVPEVISALRALDGRAEVEVIVIARGGGSLEDLLPFSDEALIRAVAACRTPVVSAIGHEQDSPLLDLVADVRASTPTDAAKRVVPAVAEELALVGALRDRGAGRDARGGSASRPPGWPTSAPGRGWPRPNARWRCASRTSRRPAPGCAPGSSGGSSGPRTTCAARAIASGRSRRWPRLQRGYAVLLDEGGDAVRTVDGRRDRASTCAPRSPTGRSTSPSTP